MTRLPTSGSIGLVEVQNDVFGSLGPTPSATSIGGQSLQECLDEAKPAIASGNSLYDFIGHEQQGSIWVQSTWNTQIFWAQDHNSDHYSIVGNDTLYELNIPANTTSGWFEIIFSKTDTSYTAFASGDNLGVTVYDRVRDLPQNGWTLKNSKGLYTTGGYSLNYYGYDYKFVFDFYS
jgi:hypothetical protein